jgi:uncharacterized protein (TIGR02246 family)
MTEAQGFVQRWEEAWREPSARFPTLFHEDGTLFQAGMERPIGRAEIGAHVAAHLASIPDFTVRARRWAASDDDLFIEWTARGTLPGSPAPRDLHGASRFTLRDGLIAEEIAYFDTAVIAGQPARGGVA